MFVLLEVIRVIGSLWSLSLLPCSDIDGIISEFYIYKPKSFSLYVTEFNLLSCYTLSCSRSSLFVPALQLLLPLPV